MNNTTTQTESSAVQDARENVGEDCRKVLKAFYADKAKEKFEQYRGEIFSRATHMFLREILHGCEMHDTSENVKNLEVALRLIKLKLKAESV